MSVILSEEYDITVTVMEKYFKTKCTPAGLLFNVNAMLYFKFKLQLQFRNNKNYSSIILISMRVHTLT